ncbi:MAG TPA: 2'-5' RNA ligase family protein [Gemmatimonadaceae bacterium]|nr:2'-5' RNA ligase family protein [Gemmatimonadaceae bacterium]
MRPPPMRGRRRERGRPVKSGLIIIAPVEPPLRERVLELQRRFDPKLAALQPPHVTVAGSSGLGPISTRTTEAELRAELEPIARETAPLSLPVGAPVRFMQSNVVVLPLAPHGAIRELHDRIGATGLLRERARFTFTPHVTLSFFPEPTPDNLRRMLALRIEEPVVLTRIQVHETLDLTRTRMVLELPLTGEG